VLRLDGLSRTFGDVVALDDVSFDVAPGHLTGFVGPNGAGKTTAMRIVMGMTLAEHGVATWQGAPIGFEQRQKFGYMPEERGLYPKMRVRDQITYFARLHGLSGTEAGRRADEWLERVGLTERATSQLQELSLGNQQRVQLAVALVHEPELLVLDEPFSGLDPVAVSVMSDVLRDRAAAGVAVLFSSHQLDLVEDLCEQVAIINAGRIVASGALADLQRRGRTRLDVVVDAPPSWIDVLPGVEVIRRNGDGDVLLVLPDDMDPQQVLTAALAAGELQRFSPAPPSLSELFLDAVRGGS